MQTRPTAGLRVLSCLLAMAATQVAMTADVPKWSVYDIALSASGNSTNWYTDPNAAVTATFTGPGRVCKTTTGFWNGGNNFIIRFTTTIEGIWTYTTSSNNAGLNHRTGTIHATAPLATNHGFLRIDTAHPTSFVWDDGTRFFMQGQTYYSLMQSAMVNDNWKEAVDNSLKYGMNKVRLFVYAQGGFLNSGETAASHGYPNVIPYAGSPENPNRDSLNFSYLKKLDQVVRYMQCRGMVADLILTNFYPNGRMAGTDAQNDRFVKYVINRYAAFDNVIWCLANEWAMGSSGPHPQDQDDYNRIGGIVRGSDPWLAHGTALRPLSIHQNTRPDFQFFGTSWPTHAIIQYGPRNKDGYAHGDQWGNAGIRKNLGHNMPVINDEYGYINDPGGVEMTRTQSRQAAWGIATAGGYGSMGDARLLSLRRQKLKDDQREPGVSTETVRASPLATSASIDSGTTWYPCRTGEWADARAEYGDVKRMVDFFTAEGVEYWKMSSRNELKTAGSRTYVLAEPGRQYVAYAAVGGAFSLDLAAGTYHAWRYNPRTGQTSKRLLFMVTIQARKLSITLGC